MAKTVVTQIMFRRFEVTTGNNPDRSGAFNGFSIFARIALLSHHRLSLRHGCSCERGLSHLEWHVSARSQMRPTKRLTALVCRLSTDELSLRRSAYARSRPNRAEGRGWTRPPRCSPLL